MLSGALLRVQPVLQRINGSLSDRGFISVWTISGEMSLFFASETFSGFHELFFFVGVHLGEVDIHGVRVSFFLLLPSVPMCGFFFSRAVLFPHIAERFAHSPSGVVFSSKSLPTC